MRWNQLERHSTGLLIVDVQDALVAQVDRACEVVHTISLAVRGCQLLGLPLCVTEQYPQGLGATTAAITAAWDDTPPPIFSKTSFSALHTAAIRDYVLSLPVHQWIVVGMEAHICVLQTAKDLVRTGRVPVILNDAITSRSVFDFSTAIAELRDLGIRVTSLEAALFELVADSHQPEFKALSRLIK
jgi:nicotinamidase-related amidase